MTVESKSLSKIYKDVGLEPLGKRTRRPPINHDINFPPKKKSKLSNSKKSTSPVRKSARVVPRKPNGKGGYDLCESDDDDDGLLTGSEESESEINIYREKSKKKKKPQPKSKKVVKRKKKDISSEDSEDASASN